MIWLIFVGLFVIGVYWMRSRSLGGVHHNPQARDAHLRLLEQKRIEAEIAFRQADQQRHHRGWRVR